MQKFLSTFLQSGLCFVQEPFLKRTLPKVPWKASDGVKMVIFSALFLLAVSWGSFFIGAFFTDLLTVSTILIENLKLFIVLGLLLQVLGQIFFLFLFSAKKYKVKLKDFGFRKVNLKTILLSLISLFAISILAQNGILFTMKLMGIAPMANQGTISSLISNNLLPLWVLFGFAVVVAPLLEELIFRGFLLSSLMNKTTPFWSAMFSSVLFATAHLQLVYMPIYFVMGLLLSFVFLKTRSLWPGITFHAVNNLVALLLII